MVRRVKTSAVTASHAVQVPQASPTSAGVNPSSASGPYSPAFRAVHLLSEDVVCRRGVEIEVGQREGHQKSLRSKWQLEIANLEDDFAPFERVHLGRQPQPAVARG